MKQHTPMHLSEPFAGPAAVQPSAGSSIDLTVSSVATVEDLQELQSEWEYLSSRDGESGLYLSFPWMSRLLKANHGRWRVYTVRTDDSERRLVCLFPVTVESQSGDDGSDLGDRLGAAGRLTLSDRTGFLCDPDFSEEGPAALARQLASERWGRISLRYEPTGKRSRAFAGAFDKARFRVNWKDHFINNGQTNYLITPTIDLPDSFETYLANHLGAQTRRSMRRAIRKHLESGECRVTIADDRTLEKDLGILADIWCSQWSAEYDDKALTRSVRRHRQYYLMAHELDAFRLSILWRGDTPLGAQACVIDRLHGDLIAKQGARVLSETLPVGNLLLLNEARWAIEAGLRRFDLGHGDAAYKYSLGASEKVTHYFSIRRRSGARG